MSRFAIALHHHRKACGPYSQTIAEVLVVKVVDAVDEAEAHRIAIAEVNYPSDWYLYHAASALIPDIARTDVPKAQTIGAVITTRNEAETIGDLVLKLRAHGLAVIVVDAASEDQTAGNALAAGATVIHAGRLPIGPALMLGWRAGLEAGWSRIVQIDAGGSHDPADLPGLLAVDADLVIGSRFCRGGRHVGNPRRALLSRAAAAACSWAQSGANYSDWTSGYRVLSARCALYLAKTPYRATMHGWQIETLARAGEAGFSIREAPITYTAGRSSLNRAVAWEAFMAWNDLVHHIGWVGSRLREEGLS